jgi:hypothetical protein
MWRRGTIFAFALLFISVLIIGSSSSFRECIQGKHETKSYHDLEEHISAVIFLPHADRYRECIGTFIHDYRDETLTGFTVVLAFSTIFLWIATRDLVEGAEETARRQLRAYLSMSPKGVGTARNEERIVRVEWFTKNHGQTPASEIHHIFNFDVLPNPLPAAFVYPPATVSLDTNSILAPGQDMTTWFDVNRLLTTEEFTEVERNARRFHVWGTTFYRDAFGRQRQMDLRASVGGGEFIANLRATHRGQSGPDFKWSWEAGHGAEKQPQKG